jgi:ATP-binding cassette, subfamily C (CFTR/MRP), member 1
MQTALLVLYAIKPTLRTRATLAAAVLTLVDALGLCLLSHAEHLYSIRPSAIINVYLLITLIFDIARARTMWLEDGGMKSVAAVFSSAIGVKVMVLSIEAIEKREILLERYRYSSPEVTSGIYSRKFSIPQNLLPGILPRQFRDYLCARGTELSLLCLRPNSTFKQY